MPLERAPVRVTIDEEARDRGLLVAFSDREGGVSQWPYDSLNLAVRVGDDRGAVAENRGRVAAVAGFDLGSLTLARQVHGTLVVTVDDPGSVAGGEADGLITDRPGVVLGLLTADCAAVVLAGEERVAVLHAGWRGLAEGIVGEGVAAVGRVWKAWVGPAIRDCCYEVGPEVIHAFRYRSLPVGNRRVDIAEAARAALSEAGVSRVSVSGVCTSCNDRYFSYRRDALTGRQGAFVSRLST